MSRKGQNYYRFTPTRVGRLPDISRTASAIAVHPHTRGEIRVWFDDDQLAHGSPPHAWGDCEGWPSHNTVYLE